MESEQKSKDPICEEYAAWKATCSLLYDYVTMRCLVWPSLTVQWLPGSMISTKGDFSIQRLILGTHTSNNEQNYLIVAQVQTPIEDREELAPSEGITAKPVRVQYEVEIPHQGEVNRARHMPQQSNLIATKTVNGEVHIFDYTKTVKSDSHQQIKPEIRLLGHKKEGYGLNWNKINRGQLLSGSDDKLICLWDLESAQGSKTLEPVKKFEEHSGVVEDVAWHRSDPFVFGSAGDDKKIMIWDLRAIPPKPSHTIMAHEAEVLSLDFSEHFIASSSSDHTVAVWDLRNLSAKLHSFNQHRDEVNHVSWSPTSDCLLASASVDRRILLWDISKTKVEDPSVPPQLLFSHRGHTSRISEVSWNPQEPMFLASVAEDNILQVWQVAREIYSDSP